MCPSVNQKVKETPFYYVRVNRYGILADKAITKRAIMRLIIENDNKEKVKYICFTMEKF